MKFFRRNSGRIDTAMDAELAADLTRLYAVPVPQFAFDTIVTGTTGPVAKARLIRQSPRRALSAAALAVAAAAVLLIVPSAVGNGSMPVSAQEVVQRAASVAGTPGSIGLQGYHVVSHSRAGEGAAAWASVTESWYDGEGRTRTESNWAKPGTPPTFLGQATDGARSWLYADVQGSWRVAEGPADMVGPSPAGPVGASGVADLLNFYTGGTCSRATLADSETLLGRTVYRIEVHSTPATCVGEKADAWRGQGSTIWVDSATFVTLKLERRDDAGNVGYQYEVTTFDVGTIDDAVFTYKAPAHVDVVHVADLSAAKQVIAGAK